MPNPKAYRALLTFNVKILFKHNIKINKNKKKQNIGKKS